MPRPALTGLAWQSYAMMLGFGLSIPVFFATSYGWVIWIAVPLLVRIFHRSAATAEPAPSPSGHLTSPATSRPGHLTAPRPPPHGPPGRPLAGRSVLATWRVPGQALRRAGRPSRSSG